MDIDLTDWGWEGGLLSLLLIGHFFADFCLQTEWMVQNKKRLPVLLLHGLLVFLSHLVFTAAVGGSLLALLGGLAAVHTMVDWAKLRVEHRWPERRAEWFMLDQSLHVAVILLIWAHLVHSGSRSLSYFGSLPLESLAVLTELTILSSGLIVVWNGGTAFVRAILERYPAVIPDDGRTSRYSMGRTIGVFERLLIFSLVVLDQWAAIGLVLAAKSLARFSELQKGRDFAEYYLIGTLASLSVAVGAGLAVRFLL